MNIFYIEQSEKVNIIKRLFRTIELKNKKIIINSDLKKASLRKKIKIAKKVNAILNKNKCKIVINSKSIKENVEFTSLLLANNIEIIEGKSLFKMLICNIVDYILEKQNKIKEKSEITITVNQYNKFIEETIKKLAVSSKAVKVVTSHIQEFQKLENNLYEEGIIVTVSNNKRKSLLNSSIILNIDFPKEVLNMYTICDEAIIVNFEENVKIKKKRFSGTIINSYMLKVKSGTDLDKFIKENDLEKYELNDICEYYYYLDNVNFDDIKLECLIKSDGEKF